MVTKTKRKNNKKSFKILALALVVAAVLVAVGLLYHNHYSKKTYTVIGPTADKSSTINYSPSKPSDNAANNARKSGGNEAPTLDNSSTASTTVPLSITVTRAGVAGSDLQVGTLANGLTSGTCNLSVTQNGESPVTQEEQIQKQNNAYDCPVFNIPLSDFPNQGNWNVSVSVTSAGKTQSAQWEANPIAL